MKCRQNLRQVEICFTRSFYLILVLLFAITLTACSDTESELSELVKQAWLDKHGDHIIVESVKLLDMREISAGGHTIVETEFESVVVVKTPIRTHNCFSISDNLACPLSFSGTPVIPTGRYKDKTNHTFKKWKSGWRRN